MDHLKIKKFCAVDQVSILCFMLLFSINKLLQSNRKKALLIKCRKNFKIWEVKAP